MVEMVDIVAKDGMPTGRKTTIAQVHKTGEWHAGVHMWIVDEYNRILMQYRAIDVAIFPGVWDMSAGGHVRSGEKPIEAAIRETKEELGLEYTAEQMSCIWVYEDSFEADMGTYINNEIDFVYLIRIKGELGRIELDEEEVMNVRWINKVDLEIDLVENPDVYAPRMNEYRKLLSTLT